MPPTASAQESDDSGLFLGDSGAPEGFERLEAVRVNGGVNEGIEPFTPERIDLTQGLPSDDPALPVADEGESPVTLYPIEAVPDVEQDGSAPAPDVTTTDTESTGADSAGSEDTAADSATDSATDSTATESSEPPGLDPSSIDTTGVVAEPSEPILTATPPLNVDYVAPVGSDDEFDAVVSESVAQFGGRVVTSFQGSALVDVPTPARPALTEQLAARGIELREPFSLNAPIIDTTTPDYGRINSSAIGLTRANLFHKAGYKGGGVKIGVIDFFEINKYWNTTEMGAKPVAGKSARCIIEGKDCTNRMFSGGVTGTAGDAHGAAVVEVIRDMAPQAQIFVGAASTYSDYYALLRWFKSKGVTILSRSLGSRYDSAGNGDGPYDRVASFATSQNMVWVNSGGNSGDGNYYRHKVRLSGNNVVFGKSGNDTLLPYRGSCFFLAGVRWANDWYKPPSQRTDYDVYLMATRTGQPPSSAVPVTTVKSERRQNLGASPLEVFDRQGCANPGFQLYLRVVWRSGPRDGDTLEILDYAGGFTKHTSKYYAAATSVVTSKERAVLSVGAIDPPTRGQIAVYSSRGPSNDDRALPSLSAPSGFANSVYGSFSGTSASAPVVAGGLALLKQAKMASNNSALADLARNSVIDRGPKGVDNTFGTGQFRLPYPNSGRISAKPSQFFSLKAPKRMLDTRPDQAIGPKALIGKMWYGEILRLPVRGKAGIPKDATAVAINLTTVEANVPSYTQAYPTGYGSVGAFSNVNTDLSRQIRANFAIVPIGRDGTISLYSAFGGNLVVDALGYFKPAGANIKHGRFRSIGTPQRVLNTRGSNSPTGKKPLRDGQVIKVPMPKGVKASQISALVVTVTGADPTQPAVLQAYPRGAPKSRGKTSTVNLDQKLDAANLAIVPTTGGGINIVADVQNGGSVHVIVDVIGYMTSAKVQRGGSGRFVPVVPGRALDSRDNGGFLTDKTVRKVRGSDAPGVKIPNTAAGIMWNLTVTETQRPGVAVAWPFKTKRPGTSALNWGPGYEQTRAAAVIAGAKQGASNFALRSDTPKPVPNAQLVVDVFGYFT